MGITNKKFAEEDDDFNKACNYAGITVHKYCIHKRDSKSMQQKDMGRARQASKYRNKKGLAYKTQKGL